MDVYNLGVDLQHAFFYNWSRRSDAKAFSLAQPWLCDESVDTFSGQFVNFKIPGDEGLFFKSFTFRVPMDSHHQGGPVEHQDPYRVTFRALISESPSGRAPSFVAEIRRLPEHSIVGDVPVHIFKKIFCFYRSKKFSAAQSMFFSFLVCFPGNPNRLSLIDLFLTKQRPLPLSIESMHGFEECYYDLCLHLKRAYFRRFDEHQRGIEQQQDNEPIVLSA